MKQSKIEVITEKVASVTGRGWNIVVHLILLLAAFSLPLWTPAKLSSTLLAITTWLSVESYFMQLFNQNITNKAAGLE